MKKGAWKGNFLQVLQQPFLKESFTQATSPAAGPSFGNCPKRRQKRFVPPMQRFYPPTTRGGTADPQKR